MSRFPAMKTISLVFEVFAVIVVAAIESTTVAWTPASSWSPLPSPGAEMTTTV